VGILLRLDDALRLPALDVQEDAGVVAALAPGDRPRPVDAHLPQRRHALRLGKRREQSLPAEPFVDPDPAVEALGSVVRDDEHDGLVIRVLEQPRDQAVEVLVVVEDRVLEPVARLVLPVLPVHELPEPVVHPVGPHLDHDKQ
jgi:hypothetical protein